jgi:cytochrome c553
MLARLQEYKNGTRPGTIMPQLSKGYTDEQLETIALQLGQKP